MTEHRAQIRRPEPEPSAQNAEHRAKRLRKKRWHKAYTQDPEYRDSPEPVPRASAQSIEHRA